MTRESSGNLASQTELREQLDRMEGMLADLLTRPVAPTKEQILAELEKDAKTTLARRQRRKQTRPPAEGTKPESQS